MKKEYKSVQQILGLEALVSDKDGGCYFVETLMDGLEAEITNLNQRSATLDAKLEEVASLNETIQSLKDSLAEKEQAVNSCNETIESLNSQINEINKKIENADKSSELVAQKDSEIEALNEQIKSLNEQLAQKDSEIEALAKSPASPKLPNANGGGEQTEVRPGPQNAVKPGMDLKQMKEALENRYNSLVG